MSIWPKIEDTKTSIFKFGPAVKSKSTEGRYQLTFKVYNQVEGAITDVQTPLSTFFSGQDIAKSGEFTRQRHSRV